MSILARLLLLAVMSVLPPAVLEVWRTERYRQEKIAEVRVKALRLAEIAAAEQMRILEGARQLLTALAMVPVIQRRDEAHCSPALQRLREQFPVYTVIGAADLSGRIWCSSANTGADVSDRLWFRRALEAESFTVGGYLVGRARGVRTMNLVLPVYDTNRQFVSVLHVGLDLALLSEDLARRQPEPGISLTIVNPEGIVLVDLPDGRRVGQGLPERLSYVLQANQPGVIDTDWINGSRQIVAYIPTTPYVGRFFLVAVGLDYTRFVGDVHRQWPSLAVSAVVLVAALLAAWFFANAYIRRPIAKLIAVTERWRRGDMTARVGRIDRNSEFSQLGLAFDAMADTVVKRERRMSDMLESTTDSVLAIDPDWRVTFQNHRAQARFERIDLLGRHLWEVVPDLEAGPVGDAYRQAMNERIPAQITFFYEPLSGHFEVNLYPSEDGGITVFVREVTEEVWSCPASMDGLRVVISCS